MAWMKIADRISNYQKFKNKWIWWKVDTDWWYWYQCTDLAKQYAKEIYWVTLWNFWWSAYKWFLNWSKTFDTTKWKKVEYTPWMIPIAWDIIFWKPTASNSYWHVAIAWDKSTSTILDILEQNYVAENNINFWKWTWTASISNRQRNYNNFAWSWRFIW